MTRLSQVSILGPASHRWKEDVAEEPADFTLASRGLKPGDLVLPGDGIVTPGQPCSTPCPTCRRPPGGRRDRASSSRRPCPWCRGRGRASTGRARWRGARAGIRPRPPATACCHPAPTPATPATLATPATPGTRRARARTGCPASAACSGSRTKVVFTHSAPASSCCVQEGRSAAAAATPTAS